MDDDNAKHIRFSGSYAMVAIPLTSDCLATFIPVHMFPARAKKFSIPWHAHPNGIPGRQRASRRKIERAALEAPFSLCLAWILMTTCGQSDCRTCSLETVSPPPRWTVNDLRACAQSKRDNKRSSQVHATSPHTTRSNKWINLSSLSLLLPSSVLLSHSLFLFLVLMLMCIVHCACIAIDPKRFWCEWRSRGFFHKNSILLLFLSSVPGWHISSQGACTLHTLFHTLETNGSSQQRLHVRLLFNRYHTVYKRGRRVSYCDWAVAFIVELLPNLVGLVPFLRLPTLMKCVTMGQYTSVCTVQVFTSIFFARPFGFVDAQRYEPPIYSQLATINCAQRSGILSLCDVICINMYGWFAHIRSNVFHRH